MLALALAAAVVISPPLPGDERTEILAAANALLLALDKGTSQELERLVDPEGRMVVVDRTKASEESITKRSMRQFITELPGHKDRLIERMGIPTLMQRGGLAQVWAPYTFWVNGKISHCGIDNFTMIKREERWIVSDLSYTREPVSACAALGAPAEAE